MIGTISRLWSWTESLLRKKKKVQKVHKVLHREVNSDFCNFAGLLFDVVFYIYPSYKSLEASQEQNNTINTPLMIYWLMTAFFLMYEKYVRIYYGIGLETVRRMICVWFLIPVMYNDLINIFIPMVTSVLSDALAQTMPRNVWNVAGCIMNQRIEAQDIASVQEFLLNFDSQNRIEPQNVDQPPNESDSLEKV